MNVRPVALDSTVLIAAVQHVRGTAAEDDPVPERSLALIQTLRDQEIDVVIPAVSESEYLVGPRIGPSDRELTVLGQDFIVWPLDRKAGAIAASIHRAHRDSRPDMPDNDRQTVKADCFVLGSAIAAGASRLYTTDDRLIRMARSLPTVYDAIEVCEVPTFARQDPVFEKVD